MWEGGDVGMRGGMRAWGSSTASTGARSSSLFGLIHQQAAALVSSGTAPHRTMISALKAPATGSRKQKISLASGATCSRGDARLC